jgi:2,5-diketo-D-gluconate reductase B
LPLLRRTVEEIRAPIACNQVEYHALLDQKPVLDYLQSKSIPLVAYCPLAKGQLADRPELASIARKHQATPAQVALKWLLDQPGVAAIPKARHPERQAANLAALQLSLDADDRRAIAALPKNLRFVNPAFAPAWD